jgi:hypothetical protein
MRLVALLLCVALAAGCSHAAVGVGTGAPPSGPVPPAGTASITTGSGATALLLLLTFGAIDYANNPQPFPNPASFFSQSPPAPELATGRRISEQDCSKPVDLTLGNLRCK